MDIPSAAEQFNFSVSSTEPMPTVFTAQSKAYFYCKEAVCAFVFRQGKLPVNPFMAYGYFLGDRVDRDLVRQANNQLIALCEELWVFGDIANGVMFEILLAKRLAKPIRYFTIAANSGEITEVALSGLRFESEMALTREQIDAFLRLAAE
ncbi:MAG: hypothetical protein FWC27_02325 [Firmicutes bacterium]|nr:hypothetical protein [Bacillota bacterium]